MERKAMPYGKLWHYLSHGISMRIYSNVKTIDEYEGEMTRSRLVILSKFYRNPSALLNKQITSTRKVKQHRRVSWQNGELSKEIIKSFEGKEKGGDSLLNRMKQCSKEVRRNQKLSSFYNPIILIPFDCDSAK